MENSEIRYFGLFEIIKINIGNFRTECEQFGIEKLEMPFFDEMENDLKSYENNWLLYEQFNNGLQEMANEEWLLFR